ncbi:M48 family metallopeptidase [Bradyrhizobium sp. NBAIM08]|uniref:M48 family metallopeptidase n=1 Tax=Bradyrhizobium sp. NBAIM08 TaxID=2793815 RepID=UPI001CD32CEF|nr:M48 family metallopeptidase [Bradyrhizobium sp. NBAIM08]MCA1476639.1 M48 family metalloprotease [Bradyrhizobium sp. NBAIM08]
MKRLILQIVLRLGRYAVLPVVALACTILAIWLMIMDRYTIAALATAPIVFTSSMATIALAIGLLFLPSRKHGGFEADEQTAPGLWAAWRELDRSFVRSNRTLLVDTDFNASISEESRYAGVFGQHVTMTIGLPLLMILDQRSVRAVIAHEVAHARLRHTSGGTNLADFMAAAENVFFYADPEHTITGYIARILLHSLLERLEKEYKALSRENELAADLEAAEQVGREEMARALVMMEVCGARLADLVIAPLQKEVLGAIKAPSPPFARILDQIPAIRAPGFMTAAVASLSRQHNPDSTHPPFGQRLASLGYIDVPDVGEIQMSAVDQLLSPDAANQLTLRFDEEWRKKVQEWVSVGR